jgi:hypothetical protein
MKTKTKFILKSLADLPANILALAASVPPRTIEMAKRVLAPPVRANVPLKQKVSWSDGGWLHGGLND